MQVQAPLLYWLFPASHLLTSVIGKTASHSVYGARWVMQCKGGVLEALWSLTKSDNAGQRSPKTPDVCFCPFSKQAKMRKLNQKQCSSLHLGKTSLFTLLNRKLNSQGGLSSFSSEEALILRPTLLHAPFLTFPQQTNLLPKQLLKSLAFFLVLATYI